MTYTLKEGSVCMSGTESNVHKDHRIRMRKKFRQNGFDGFEEHEILEVLLYYCVPRKDTNELAHDILDKYKTLANVFDATPDELMKETGISEVTATLLSMVPKLSQVYETSKWERVECLNGTEELGQYTVSLFKDKLNEEFALICLDSNRHVHWSGIIIKGTIDRTEAYPRVVVDEALKHKATKVVLAHNHPNGTLAPSVSDKEATDVLKKILGSIGIDVLDHIIVSGNRYFSMKEMGFIK